MYNSLYGNYRQKTFSEIWEDEIDFTVEFQNSKLSGPFITVLESGEEKLDDHITTLFYLLYARYGNSTIASSDTNRFKYDLYSIIYNYGPAWIKKLELQSELRKLTPEELQEGAEVVQNLSLNPSTAPKTDAYEALDTVNQQTASKRKRSKVDSIAYLWELLENDVTEPFIEKFKRLFLRVIQPENPLFYVTVEDEEEV